MSIKRETREEITGSVSRADVRDMILFGLKACAHGSLIEKVEPFSDGVYVTFANGQRFQLDVNEPGQSTQRQRREAALEQIKKVIAAVELPT